ncbi:MAG: hypothetical protein HN368_13050 [Spirochaetales bacterium]|jgi:hypothetical protein|nr:hypothetical protein [Spirochaetales bacterium]
MLNDEPSGEYYDWTITGKPERPWLLPYHQTLVYKVMNCIKDGSGEMKEVYLTFEQTLEVIRKIYNMTCGIPQVIYLTGWQYEGHDSKYPSWAKANRHLKRAEDDTAEDSLRWLMREAKKYNTRVSLHINMIDAYPDSPLWDLYVEKDIIAKDIHGKVIPGKEWGGAVSYQMSYTQEWKHGLAQKRIDDLLKMLPELQDSKTIHIDAFLGARPADKQGIISPYLGYSREQEAATQRKIYRYWRDRGIDVTSEWVYGLRDDRFVGLQPWTWHQGDEIEDLPDKLYCTTEMKAEREITADPENLDGLSEQFYLKVLPWYYKNNETGVKGSQKIVDGTDICIPAYWCAEKTLIAFSKDGYESKTWTLPPDWIGAEKVFVSRITLYGPEESREIPVIEGRVDLAVESGESVKICAELGGSL